MDEVDVRQRARAFIAKVDTSDIRTDLTPYVVAANAKVKREELDEGESGAYCEGAFRTRAISTVHLVARRPRFVHSGDDIALNY